MPETVSFSYGERTHQVVLHRRLGAAPRTPATGGQRVDRDRHGLDPDEDGDRFHGP